MLFLPPNQQRQSTEGKMSRPNNVDDIISMLERDKKQVVQSKD